MWAWPSGWRVSWLAEVRGEGRAGRGGQVGTAATSGRRGVSSEGVAAAALVVVRPITGGFPGNAQDQCPPAFAPSCWLRASSPYGVATALDTPDSSDFLVVSRYFTTPVQHMNECAMNIPLVA